MSKGKLFFGAVLLALIVAAVFWRGGWSTEGATALVRGLWPAESAAARTPAAGSRPAARAVPVETARAERKTVPVTLQALGTVTPIASVAIKARVDTSITAVHFQDGALVHKGDPLFTLDDRAIRAQIAQIEGQLARDRAQLEGAERDVRRYTDLVAKGATPIINLDNAKTQSDVFKAAIQADQGNLENQQVQLSYTTITAPITGRISAAAVKVGNFVRQADTTPMATINQMAPVYVSFTVPQKSLPDIREAIAAKTASITALIPGSAKPAQGAVTMIENTVDTATGMATIRASMPNNDEALWPGTLVNVEMTLRHEDGVVAPSTAIQVSQTGNFVFVIADGKSRVQPVKVERQIGNMSVIASGLKGGETVVTDGQLLLSDGTRVEMRKSETADAQTPAGS
jgi:multidrug efflux system membrane fusion protein